MSNLELLNRRKAAVPRGVASATAIFKMQKWPFRSVGAILALQPFYEMLYSVLI